MSKAVLEPRPTRKERRVKRVEYVMGANYLLFVMGASYKYPDKS
jgi:hypothetical protein